MPSPRSSSSFPIPSTAHILPHCPPPFIHFRPCSCPFPFPIPPFAGQLGSISFLLTPKQPFSLLKNFPRFWLLFSAFYYFPKKEGDRRQLVRSKERRGFRNCPPGHSKWLSHQKVFNPATFSRTSFPPFPSLPHSHAAPFIFLDSIVLQIVAQARSINHPPPSLCPLPLMLNPLLMDISVTNLF
jgi:hypothetical protein